MKKKSSVASRVLNALKEAERHNRGERVPGMRITHYPAVDIREIRARLKVNQKEFAEKFGLSLDSVQNWEQGRTVPDRPARILLAVISENPKLVERAVQKALTQDA
jgi:putative transcriptional regulator